MNAEVKPLTGDQLASLVKMVGGTTDEEFDCAQFLAHVGEFAEAQLSRQQINAVLAKVEQHLAMCPECREEYEALQRILSAAA